MTSLAARYWARKDNEPLTCRCDDPTPDPIGECGHCHRLVATTVPLEFEILGDPAAQGSKRAFVVAGKARMTEMGGAKHKHWRTAVAEAAADVAAHTDVAAPLDGPLGLSVEFRFAMPSSRPKRLRAVGRAVKTSAPDLDKLLRALCDGLTAGGLIRDDARICALEACKVEVVGWTGASVRITREDAL